MKDLGSVLGALLLVVIAALWAAAAIVAPIALVKLCVNYLF